MLGTGPALSPRPRFSRDRLPRPFGSLQRASVVGVVGVVGGGGGEGAGLAGPVPPAAPRTRVRAGPALPRAGEFGPGRWVARAPAALYTGSAARDSVGSDPALPAAPRSSPAPRGRLPKGKHWAGWGSQLRLALPMPRVAQQQGLTAFVCLSPPLRAQPRRWGKRRGGTCQNPVLWRPRSLKQHRPQALP